MKEQTVIDLYNVIQVGLTEIADLMEKYSDQLEANRQLTASMQWQIINLKKRIEVLEGRVKEQPAT